MNETAKVIGLAATNYSVAHGMHHDRNVSSAIDIATASINAMRNPVFC
jgi:D-alanyl-D-alanine carboxypeptidase